MGAPSLLVVKWGSIENFQNLFWFQDFLQESSQLHTWEPAGNNLYIYCDVSYEWGNRDYEVDSCIKKTCWIHIKTGGGNVVH